MRVGFLPVDLARWDQAAPGDLLAVGLWSDVRPLRGAVGLLDWRLCGGLGALLAAGSISGAADEKTLLPGARRLVWRYVLCVGLGARGEFSERRFVRALHRTLVTMRGLKVGRLAVALPGRDTDRIPVRRAFELLMKESEETLPGIVEDLTIIEPPAVQKEMAELLRQRATKRA